MKQRRRNFTLLELLIVIGIIALLLAMQVGSFNRAKQSARFIRWYAFNKQCSYDPSCVINFNFQEKKGIDELTNSAVGCESEGFDVTKYKGVFHGDLEWCEGRWPGRKKGLRFNGVNTYVEIDRIKALNFSGKTDFTICVWVKFDEFRRWDGLFSKSYWGSPEAALAQYDLYYDGSTYDDSEAAGQFEIDVCQKCVGYDDVTVEGEKNVTLNTDDWFHIVMRHRSVEGQDVGNVDVFVNGRKMVERATNFYVSKHDVCDARMIIGAIRWMKNGSDGQPTLEGRIANNFSGIIDEFMIYSKAISDNDVKNHYNEGKP